jgi:hypothetical protein
MDEKGLKRRKIIRIVSIVIIIMIFVIVLVLAFFGLRGPAPVTEFRQLQMKCLEAKFIPLECKITNLGDTLKMSSKIQFVRGEVVGAVAVLYNDNKDIIALTRIDGEFVALGAYDMFNESIKNVNGIKRMGAAAVVSDERGHELICNPSDEDVVCIGD